MAMLKVLLLVQLLYSVSTAQLDLVFEWNNPDLQFPSPEIRKQQLADGSFIPTDINIKTAQVYRDRIFIQLYDHRGAPVTLAYANLTDTSTKSPILIPYPSWEAFSPRHGPLIHSVRSIHVDRCDRLWVLDRDEKDGVVYHSFFIFNLTTDRIIRQHEFSNEGYRNAMAVDDSDCEDTYVYVSNDYKDEVWVYSWLKDESWSTPIDKIWRMLPSPNNALYYNKPYTNEVFSVPTEHLRKEGANLKENERKLTQNIDLSVAALGYKDVLYYFDSKSASNIIHSLPCWDKQCDSIRGDIQVGNDAKFQVSYLFLDGNGKLWTLSLPKSFNAPRQFRIHSGTVIDDTKN